MPPTPFGERLKRERELRGVSLDEVSIATRINTRFLEALEAEQWDVLPGGVFNRGFIRTIARYLGMNEDGLISEYAMVTKDHPTVTVWVQDLEKPRSKWIPAAIVVAAIALIIFGGWLAAKRWGTAARGDANAAKVALIAPVLAGPEDSGAAKPASAPAAADRGAPDARDAAPLETHTVAEPDNSSSAVVPAANVVPANSNVETLHLQIESGRKTRIRVIADGRVQFSGSIAAGETRNYSARNIFKVSAADSAAVLIELNGKTMAPLGTPGRPGRVTLTREDLRESSGGAH